ncbi:hypothetical protein N494_09965 [Clostridium botulinum A2B7 92]|uniref:DUF6064 family protein n=1 Tax=Clostridium botulinum TaxID=1491 RepID=UPI0007E12F48|nr:DUF6064 family protein [Clostridium botulinum]KEJ01280.1 hypothetical protein N494_09965 [Clostridium botulinum A2B7 92]
MSLLFWNTISNYNQSTWVAQLIICVIGIILTTLIYIKPTKTVKVLLKIFLSFSFAWISIAFFIMHGSNELNKYLTATLFGVIALLFFIDIFKNNIIFERNKRFNKLVFILYILFLSYPLISLIFGHAYPAITTWLMPCPLVVYSITLLISFSTRVDYKILILLIFWALTGLPKIFMFGVPEDFILLISGILSSFIWILIVKKKEN